MRIIRITIYSAFVLISFIVGSCNIDDGERNIGVDESTKQDQAKIEKKGFDEMSSEYYETKTRVIWQKPEIVLEVLGDIGGKTVADIGAGTGYFAFRLAAHGARVIGIDIDSRAISFMQAEVERYPKEVQESFSARLSTEESATLKPREVDVVLMVNTYIYIEDRINYLLDLQKGMTDRGELMIIDFKKKETTIGPALDNRIALIQIQQELVQAGFKILSVDDTTLEYQYIVRAVKQ